MTGQHIDRVPKQWYACIRVSTDLPRTTLLRARKRTLAAQATGCDDPMWQFVRLKDGPVA